MPGVKKSKKTKAKKKQTEKLIQKQITAWLDSTELVWWRQNSGIAFFGNRAVVLGPKGLPDIILIVPPGGRFLGLEVKSPSGHLRPAQRDFGERVLMAGGEYRIVRSLKEAQDAVAFVIGDATWKLVQK